MWGFPGVDVVSDDPYWCPSGFQGLELHRQGPAERSSAPPPSTMNGRSLLAAFDPIHAYRRQSPRIHPVRLPSPIRQH
jgi:hypothetical protein